MMGHTGQTAQWIRYLNEDFILILSSSSPITNKPDCGHMLSYSLMHVTSVVCSMFCVHVCICAMQTMDKPCPCMFCESALMQACGIYIGGTLSELESTLTLPLHTNLLYFHRNAFALFNSSLYLCTITDSDRVFPECLRLWCAKQTQTQVLVSVIDYCCLHPYTVACFPIKPVRLPLLLLPGPGLCSVYVFVCLLASLTVHGLCVFVFARLCTHFYGKISKGLRGQPPSITNSEGNGERDGGWKERWRSPQEAASGEKERGRQRKSGWMDGAVRAGSDWAGYYSLYPLEIRLGSTAQQLPPPVAWTERDNKKAWMGQIELMLRHTIKALTIMHFKIL